MVVHSQKNSSSGFVYTALLLATLMVLSFSAVAVFSVVQVGFDVGTRIVLVLISTVLSIQSLFTVYWMLYHWEDASHKKNSSVPEQIESPKTTFSLLIPARHEENVIADTLESIANLKYPSHLFEAIILCKEDDHQTIHQARQKIKALGNNNIRVHVFSSEDTDKPTALNEGLHQARNEVIAVFDAEDQPKAEILSVINSIFLQEQPDVVQGGVQLMNYNTSWFSVHNVLEYYFWFKSALHLFSKLEVIPLGGNTVFFNKRVLQRSGGWQSMLTEDADVGMRLSVAGKKIRVLYDAGLVTEEETPPSVTAFLKQRSRWNQGFLQIALTGIWNNFPHLSTKLIALYVLLLPLLTAANLFFVVISPITLFMKLPIVAALVILFPLFLLVLLMCIQLLGLWEFSRDFAVKPSPFLYLVLVFTFVPYQLLLSFAAWRAVFRQIMGVTHWEKTVHYNLHRNYT